MGLFSFIKDAGKKIFGSKEEIVAENPGADEAAVHQKQAEAIKSYVSGMGITVHNFDISFSADDQITISGDCSSKNDYEKIALIAGNTKGISSVVNNMTVGGAGVEPESQFHTVEKGDTLWAIATKFYGDGNKYQTIVEANQPMIKDADEIYPGQVLRIPA